MSAPITVILVDDHHLVRRGLRRMLEDDPDIRVLGEAADGADAIRMVHELDPRVVVMDAAMPGTGGLSATRSILAARPATAILMLSMHAEETLVREALDAGARGYVLKSAVDLDLAAAIKRVAAGETVLDPALERPAPLPGERNRLTPRELEVLQHICDGLTNRQIAERMRWSVATAKKYVQRVLEKMAVTDRTQAAVAALRARLLD